MHAFAAHSAYAQTGSLKQAIEAGLWRLQVLVRLAILEMNFLPQSFSKRWLGHILSHGATWGVITVLQGGKFGHGFVSAGLLKRYHRLEVTGLNIGGNSVAQAQLQPR